ncbi:MAG: hypothetical protein U0Q03_15795 [Acidimicrobiales bacterium]
MEHDLSDEMRDRIGAAIADVLDERAAAWSLIELATSLLADGHDHDAVVDLATVPPNAAMSDVGELFLRMIDALGLPRFPAHPKVLEYLVDHDEIDEILTITSIDEAAAAVLRSYRERSSGAAAPTGATDSDTWWAVLLLTMSAAWFADDQRARASLDSLIAQAETGFELACIGAGALENFVSDDEGDLEWLEGRLRTSTKFCEALAGAWIYNQVSPANFDRLERAAARRLTNPNRQD